MTRDRLIQSSREIRFATRFVPCDRCTRGSVADGLELSIAANQDQPFPNPDPCVADVALKLRRQRGIPRDLAHGRPACVASPRHSHTCHGHSLLLDMPKQKDGQDEDAEPGLGMRGRCRQQPGPISIPAIGYLSLSQANQDCRPVARTFNATDSGSK
ncbi:hypothetical protein M431DRAFT_499301 [Trichoderma harzianum CBS 226.95]|uniref:Uncharacterized protein n=1 Tax=Trichoderma harzianum CBS 226.95 TaxID=983964 RepID=A0A2T4A092_TRIHA|nr:hypothetical protein M431DRAFT_499301 [Trichoderma harzianum CBS 226.95]PTB50484.1 hypothetical protein M431DRAFT_499301 [Trichoderma harzianum CBS 226.95]